MAVALAGFGMLKSDRWLLTFLRCDTGLLDYQISTDTREGEKWMFRSSGVRSGSGFLSGLPRKDLLRRFGLRAMEKDIV